MKPRARSVSHRHLHLHLCLARSVSHGSLRLRHPVRRVRARAHRRHRYRHRARQHDSKQPSSASFPSGHRSPLARSRARVHHRSPPSVDPISRRVDSIRSTRRRSSPARRSSNHVNRRESLARVRDASPTLSLSLSRRRRPRRRRRRASRFCRSVAIKLILQPNALLMGTCVRNIMKISFFQPTVRPTELRRHIRDVARRRVGDALADRPSARARQFDVLVLVSRLASRVRRPRRRTKSRVPGSSSFAPIGARARGRRVIARRIIARRRVVSIASVRARTVSRELALETSSSASAG